MRLRDLLPNLPHEGPPVPRFLLPGEPDDARAGAPEKVEKPGCTVADETLVVFGHLRGLSEGWGGFGVLRESKKRLERASGIALQIGADDLASQLQSLSRRLSGVQSPDSALSLANEMKPLVRRAWELGKRCGGLSRLTKEQIKEALDRVSA